MGNNIPATVLKNTLDETTLERGMASLAPGAQAACSSAPRLNFDDMDWGNEVQGGAVAPTRPQPSTPQRRTRASVPLVSPSGQNQVKQKHSKDPLSQDKDKVAGSTKQGQDVGLDGEADDEVEVLGVPYHLPVPVPEPRGEVEAAAAAPGTGGEATDTMTFSTPHTRNDAGRSNVPAEQRPKTHGRAATRGRLRRRDLFAHVCARHDERDAPGAHIEKQTDALDRRARAQEARDRIARPHRRRAPGPVGEGPGGARTRIETESKVQEQAKQMQEQAKEATLNRAGC